MPSASKCGHQRTRGSSDVVRPPEMDIRPPEKTLGHQTPTDGGKDGIKTSIELDRISVRWNLGQFRDHKMENPGSGLQSSDPALKCKEGYGVVTTQGQYLRTR